MKDYKARIVVTERKEYELFVTARTDEEAEDTAYYMAMSLIEKDKWKDHLVVEGETFTIDVEEE